MFSRWTIFWFLLPIFLALLYPPLELNNVFVRYADNQQRDTWRKILLVIAHPDDESYFFAPTLLALLDQERELRPTVYSLCLSIGDADGFGDLRVAELDASLDVLGVDKDKRKLISHPYVPPK
jgi:N-acetylglucosaminylphosphatidylinositol deacetylase